MSTYTTALISAPIGRSYYFVTLVNGDIEKTVTCQTITEVISCINSNGIYRDSVENYDMTDKVVNHILGKINERPQESTPMNTVTVYGDDYNDVTAYSFELHIYVKYSNPVLLAQELVRIGITFDQIHFDSGLYGSGIIETMQEEMTAKAPMKAIITVSNDEMHLVKTFAEGDIIDRIISLEHSDFSPAQVVAIWAEKANADLYFAPNCKRSFVEAIIKAMGN